MSDPIFPPEIEYIIFTNALVLSQDSNDADHKSNVNLFLVARRVHTWLIPKFLRTIGIRTIPSSETYPKGFPSTTRLLEKYGTHVHNLFICTSISHLSNFPYLFYCPNITKLIFWVDSTIPPSLLTQLSSLRLTHLSIDLDHIAEEDIKTSPQIQTLFSKITHLETASTVGSKRHRTNLPYFTSLTHLAVVFETYRLDVELTFRQHPDLQVLAIEDVGTHLEVIESDTDSDSDGDGDGDDRDWRVVNVTFESGKDMQEWLLEVEEGRGMWSLADEVVRERKRKRDRWGTLQ